MLKSWLKTRWRAAKKRFEMVTIKVHAPDAFKALQGKFVRVPVGAFVADGQVKGTTPSRTMPSHRHKITHKEKARRCVNTSGLDRF